MYILYLRMCLKSEDYYKYIYIHRYIRTYVCIYVRIFIYTYRYTIKNANIISLCVHKEKEHAIQHEKSPSKNVEATYRLCKAIGNMDWGICFALLCRSCIPCHVKAFAQIFLPYRDMVEARKAAGPGNRSDFNNWVWGHLLDCEVVNKNSGFKMDGEAVSLQYSRAGALQKA